MGVRVGVGVQEPAEGVLVKTRIPVAFPGPALWSTWGTSSEMGIEGGAVDGTWAEQTLRGRA